MSKAGIQSNRGDGYQTLVAFDWALTVLSDKDHQWLEVDSVTWPVDDVVIGKVDGTKICCQCKKNQTGFNAWTVGDLADELNKAIALLTSDEKAVVRFYSRTPFGEMANLREFSSNYADEPSYRNNLGKAQKKTDEKLHGLLAMQKTNLTTYDFICRIEFVVSDELSRMQALLRERLNRLASNPSAAYDSIWTHLDQLGMRVNGNAHTPSAQHRLTKDDLETILSKAGSLLTPPLNLSQVRSAFKSTSAIGRAWRREIGEERIPSPVVTKMMSAIEAKNRSILLTGLPGSGKTCVMLDLQDRLEQLAKVNANVVPLFIQSTEFADTDTVQGRHSQGLSEQWVEGVARTAEDAHVVIVIDSLDVLSIAREHSILTYFLAQIDRLILIPNVTVVTACRDFDRHYDLRIARRTWEKEFSCRPLDWDSTIVPLLAKLGIDSSVPNAATRELIKNPRELALFVELAARDGSFNVVTSEALAMRYLTVIVQSDNSLGELAMRAIEDIASEMLKSRSLTVSPQRFTAPQNIQRALLSHNVLHRTQDGRLTFGHQTLLDVLVVSGAIRRGMTLNIFIRELPPVPFVRPSIRSFIAQLATGDRRELRKQIRRVLTGDNPFHVRRLVAETFADGIPQDDDWPLVRDLRNEYRDVFQVVYQRSVRVEWHYFWLKHLFPALKDSRDSDGLIAHINLVTRWKNDDAERVLTFWAEVLALDWVEKKQIASVMEVALSQIDSRHSALTAPLLITLLELPRQEHSFLGHSLARCVQVGAVNHSVLWRYVTRDVNDENVLASDFEKKLRCEPHEFGDSNDNFLLQQMVNSEVLLDLAVSSIRQWSQVRSSASSSHPLSYWGSFLHKTSYFSARNQTHAHEVDSTQVLLMAVEAAVCHHATAQSEWWQTNGEGLCFSTEGALRYFAILACTATPLSNLELIYRMLCNETSLESDLSYELGTLMQTAFVYLNPDWQDSIQATVLAIHQRDDGEPWFREWRLRKQAHLIITIPCHLRSVRAHELLSEFENSTWPFVREPDNRMRGGIIFAPFSFEVFLSASDVGVLRLLTHYDGYFRDSFDDFLTGGEREVGGQLREAASRNPSRFLKLLPAHWACIPHRFCDDIMEGVASYFAYRNGERQANDTWSPVEEPSSEILTQQVLDELERHPSHWRHNRSASTVLQSIASTMQNTKEAGRLVFQAISFTTLRDERSDAGEDADLLTTGINMMQGHVVEALMILARQLEKVQAAWPELLAPALYQFSAHEHRAIRALMLRRLPCLLDLRPKFGWALFDAAMEKSGSGLWGLAERCLYYSYHRQFEIVERCLVRLFREGSGRDLKTWSHISALAAFSKKIDFSAFSAELMSRGDADAWGGAASIWTHADNMRQQKEQCLKGLEMGLSEDNPYAGVVANKFNRLFTETSPPLSIPSALISRFFTLLETSDDSRRRDVFGFDSWLNATASREPLAALEATERYVNFVKRTKPYLYDADNNFTQLLTRLFAQAEEQEESDDGAMLQRVVVVQDALLALGINGLNEWLKAAERT